MPMANYNKDITKEQLINDITKLRQRVNELERFKKTLLESEERYRELVELSPCGVIIHSEDTIVFLNPAGTKILGAATSKQLIGKSIMDIVHPYYREIAKEQIRHMKEKGNHIPLIEQKYIRFDGSAIEVEVAAIPFIYQDKFMIQVVFHDITERKYAEEKLKQTLAELTRSNTELEQFAYIASHDLQEPLRNISNFSQLLMRRYKDKFDKNANQFINFIAEGSIRMQKMINNLLQYSRIGTHGKPFEPTNCEDVLNQVITNLKASVGENCAVVTHDPLPTVIADTSQLTQLFQNLINNAIKFRRKEPPRIHISAKQKRNEWLFSVQDNGIGISPESLERIFMMFQRLHTGTEYPGTGIGLAISKKIVERHGGRIWAESEPGRGSIFSFTIPFRNVE
jgi:PAS domain S-box-containing protein